MQNNATLPLFPFGLENSYFSYSTVFFFMSTCDDLLLLFLNESINMWFHLFLVLISGQSLSVDKAHVNNLCEILINLTVERNLENGMFDNHGFMDAKEGQHPDASIGVSVMSFTRRVARGQLTSPV